MKKNILLFHLYPFRPHVDYFEFLLENLKKKHNVTVIRCFNNFSNCYYKKINGDSINTCIKCNLYSNPLKDSFLPKLKPLNEENHKESLVSSLASAKRLETPEQIDDFFKKNKNEINLYNKDLNISKESFLNVLKKNKIDFVWGFNGRMDHTKMFFKACKQMDIPFISFEYPWFGNGINLIANEDCLSLKVYHYVNNTYGKYPLTFDQSKLAFKYANKRLKKIMDLEWRDFSSLKSHQKKSNYKVLILPSSRSEFEGHDDYFCNWGHSSHGFKLVIEELGIDNSDIYIQFHPIWFQKINKIDGKNPINFYMSWAAANNYNILSPSEVYERKDLILKSDIIVINGSSAGLEAGFMGKKIINVDKNKYTFSGVTIDIFDKNELSKLKVKIHNHDVSKVKRATLRFFYTIMFRVNSFEEDVIVESSTRVKFTSKNKLNVLERYMELANQKEFIINDKTFGENTEKFEDQFINKVFEDISINKEINSNDKNWKRYNKSINFLRSFIKKGDL